MVYRCIAQAPGAILPTMDRWSSALDAILPHPPLSRRICRSPTRRFFGEIPWVDEIQGRRSAMGDAWDQGEFVTVGDFTSIAAVELWDHIDPRRERCF
jgi:hypothetical protein